MGRRRSGLLANDSLENSRTGETTRLEVGINNSLIPPFQIILSMAPASLQCHKVCEGSRERLLNRKSDDVATFASGMFADRVRIPSSTV
jgi:hypothetical protein